MYSYDDGRYQDLVFDSFSSSAGQTCRQHFPQAAASHREEVTLIFASEESGNIAWGVLLRGSS